MGNIQPKNLNTLTHAHTFLPQLSMARYTPSAPALQMHCQVLTLNLLLAAFGVELLFTEPPSPLA